MGLVAPSYASVKIHEWHDVACLMHVGSNIGTAAQGYYYASPGPEEFLCTAAGSFQGNLTVWQSGNSFQAVLPTK